MVINGTTPKPKHNERCKECKIKLAELLHAVYGKVVTNYSLGIASNLDSFADTPYYYPLRRIFEALQRHRNHEMFIYAKKLPKVDFFIPSPGIVVEFDESQHFTKPRGISLLNYPEDIFVGFDRKRWVRLCQELDRKDNRPPYRDEQRAWYDTLRDFAPHILGLRPTIRLFAKDFVWCSLDPNSNRDIDTFRGILQADN